MGGQTKITDVKIGGSFDPETLAVLRTVLEDAWTALPPDAQAKTSRSALATLILKAAANGERNPAYLRASALADVAEGLLKNAN